jgi:hypothetical protein
LPQEKSVSIKSKMQKVLGIGVLGFVLLFGVPMSPKEIEELLRQVSVPKVAHSLRKQSDSGGGPPEDG